MIPTGGGGVSAGGISGAMGEPTCATCGLSRRHEVHEPYSGHVGSHPFAYRDRCRRCSAPRDAPEHDPAYAGGSHAFEPEESPSPPPKPIPFTQVPGVQADIRRTLRELLDEAERGECSGLFVCSVDKSDQVTSSMVGEKKYTLIGAALVGLVHRAMMVATGKA